MSLKQLRIVDESVIKILIENVPFPMALFDKSELLACNALCQTLISASQYNFSIRISITFSEMSWDQPKKKSYY